MTDQFKSPFSNLPEIKGKQGILLLFLKFFRNRAGQKV
jgi:hypothetical protein